MTATEIALLKDLNQRIDTIVLAQLKFVKDNAAIQKGMLGEIRDLHEKVRRLAEATALP